jgi:hypothetical protein
MTDRDWVRRWIAGYEGAWRSPGTDTLGQLFAEDVSYSPSPWAEPVQGLSALRQFWERARTGADEQFTMISDLVAVDGATAVVRVDVEYGSGERWRDLWVLTFDPEARCSAFQEWPFSPEQQDGHELDGLRPEPS